MNPYEIHDLKTLIQDNPYAGRCIVIGKTADGKQAVTAYAIMGRSANSRNRIFSLKEDKTLFTEPFDASKVEDPSLIIYAAVRTFENHLIVTNGDQTDTVYLGLQKGLSFSEALKSRCFEPDAPNFTPRISGMLTFDKDDFTYEMSILKSQDPMGTACCRYTYSYQSMAGLGHFIHTYITDGSPLPTFCGEPHRVEIPDSIDAFTETFWQGLNTDNRISLYVRYTDLSTGIISERMKNRHLQ